MKDSIPQKIIDSFFQKINKTDGCWMWTAATNQKYGIISQFKKNRFYAHRLSYIIHIGPIPKGMNVCHRCDVPLCVNPDHLFIGTTRDNIKDKIDKGRMPIREDHPMSKLRWSDIRRIRKLYSSNLLSQAEIAKLFGVSREGIGRIVRKQIWKELGE